LFLRKLIALAKLNKHFARSRAAYCIRFLIQLKKNYSQYTSQYAISQDRSERANKEAHKGKLIFLPSVDLSSLDKWQQCWAEFVAWAFMPVKLIVQQ